MIACYLANELLGQQYMHENLCMQHRHFRGVIAEGKKPVPPEKLPQLRAGIASREQTMRVLGRALSLIPAANDAPPGPAAA